MQTAAVQTAGADRSRRQGRRRVQEHTAGEDDRSRTSAKPFLTQISSRRVAFSMSPACCFVYCGVGAGVGVGVCSDGIMRDGSGLSGEVCR